MISVACVAGRGSRGSHFRRPRPRPLPSPPCRAPPDPARLVPTPPRRRPARAGKLEAFAANARIVHIDIDPAEIHKNKDAHIPVCADIKPALQILNRLLSQTPMDRSGVSGGAAGGGFVRAVWGAGCAAALLLRGWLWGGRRGPLLACVPACRVSIGWGALPRPALLSISPFLFSPPFPSMVPHVPSAPRPVPLPRVVAPAVR